MYFFIRFVVSSGIILSTVLLAIKCKGNWKKLKRALIIVLGIVLVLLDVLFPLDVMLLKFDSVEAAVRYRNGAEVQEIGIVEGEASCIAFWHPDAHTTSNCIVKKEDDEYRIVLMWKDVRRIDYFPSVYWVKGTDDYFVVGIGYQIILPTVVSDKGEYAAVNAMQDVNGANVGGKSYSYYLYYNDVTTDSYIEIDGVKQYLLDR